MTKKRSQYQGCLLGLAVGDVMGSFVDKKSWEEICRDYGPNGLMGFDLANGSAEITSYTQLAAYTSNGLLLGMSRYQPELYSKFVAAALHEWARCQFVTAAPEKPLCWLSRVGCMRRRLCMDRDVLEILYREQEEERPAGIINSPAALTCGAVAVFGGRLSFFVNSDVQSLLVVGYEPRSMLILAFFFLSCLKLVSRGRK